MWGRRYFPTAFGRSSSAAPCGPRSSVLLWLPQYFGEMSLPTAFGPLDWHIHEMIYGYVGAVSAGFLLTAIPNWTGRLPINGYPLAGLFALWFAGRVAILGSAIWGAWLAAAIDVAFLVLLAAAVTREIVAGNNKRNLRILVLLGILIAGNVVFHLEAIRYGSAEYGARLGIAAIVALISLVGGRIVPSFTHNWLTRNNPGRLPVSFSRFDAVAIGGSVLALVSWIVFAAIQHLRRDVDHRGAAAGSSLAALGGRSHARRPSRPGTPCRLRLRPDRLPAVGRGDPVARRLAAQRRPPRLDGRSRGPDDAGGYDARKPGSYRMQACRIAADAIDLSLRARRRIGAHFRGFRAVECRCSTLPRSPGSWPSAALRRFTVRCSWAVRRCGPRERNRRATSTGISSIKPPPKSVSTTTSTP